MRMTMPSSDYLTMSSNATWCDGSTPLFGPGPYGNGSAGVMGAHGSHVVQEASTDHERFYTIAQFVTGLILYPVICLVGISGNILTLIVLNHHKMITSTNVFLSALAVADLIKLFNDTLYFIVSILLRTHPMAGNKMYGYMYPFSHYIFNESVCVASWLTVFIGVERYMYVCHYPRARQLCTVNRAKSISAVVFVTMSLVAIPSALRYGRQSVHDPVTNVTMFAIELTALGKNTCFMTMYTWIISLLRSVIPLCALVVLNTCIIVALKRQRVKGKITNKNRITFMLIVVIVVFLVCITPDAIMSTVFGFGYVEESNLGKGIRECTDTLLAVNSAANFTIYCLCSQGFRDTFRLVFCTRGGSPRVMQLRTTASHAVSQRPLLASSRASSPTHGQHGCPCLKSKTIGVERPLVDFRATHHGTRRPRKHHQRMPSIYTTSTNYV